MIHAITQHALDRAPYAGVAQIVRYNWPKYIVGVLVITVLWSLASVPPLPVIVRFSLIAAAGLAMWWTCASLVASYWIYDRSGLYDLRWLPESVRTAPRWANVHAGLDEFSLPLEGALQQGPLAVVDIYDPAVMTERSIARARKGRTPHPCEHSAPHGNLALPPATCDAIFALFTAHELRSHDDRVALLREVRRALASNGAAVVMEHMRDAANAVAFGPGFTHFLSRASWLRAFEDAGLQIEAERTHTPFTRVFLLRALP